jgi:3',5'-cyclic AMP phosphodiesterase CpdA
MRRLWPLVVVLTACSSGTVAVTATSSTTTLPAATTATSALPTTQISTTQIPTTQIPTTELPATSVAPAPFRVAAAGDIACDPGDGGFHGGAGNSATCAEGATADLIGRLAPDAVLALGDLQYDDGAPAKYAASYAPTWGRFASITYPTPGNHDYSTGNLAGYRGEFGSRAGPADTTWYSAALGPWRLIVLDANCGAVDCSAGSPQAVWLEAELNAHPDDCTVAIWHQPRFSSGWHGDDKAMQALWSVLADHHVDVVLQGHDHDYERFDPLDRAGQPTANGIRSFVVGTGGAGLRPFGAPRPGSVVRDWATHGVLLLTLTPGHYDWRFEPVSGETFTDAGSGVCG